MGKQTVHEPELKVNEDRGVCEFGSALKCKQVVHEPEPKVNEDGGECEFGSVP